MVFPISEPTQPPGEVRQSGRPVRRSHSSPAQPHISLKLGFACVFDSARSVAPAGVTERIQSSVARAHAHSAARKVQGGYGGPLLGHRVVSFGAVENHGVLLPWERTQLVRPKTAAALLSRGAGLPHLPLRISCLPARQPPTRYEPGEGRTRWSSTG